MEHPRCAVPAHHTHARNNEDRVRRIVMAHTHKRQTYAQGTKTKIGTLKRGKRWDSARVGGNMTVVVVVEGELATTVRAS